VEILQVCHRYSPAIGGVEEHVRNISERLAREHTVTVFACDSSGRLAKKDQLNGVLIRRFKSFSPNDAYHISIEMLMELRRSEFDVVHGHCYHALPLLFSKYAGRQKFIVTPHYHGQGQTCIRNFLIKLYKPIGGKIFQEADKIIAVSNYERGLLLKDFRIPHCKTVVIPNGVDPVEFEKLGKQKKDHKTILFVGRLEEYKGAQYAIQALPMLDNKIRLEIVGKGPYKERLSSLARELRLETRVDFWQDLPRSELLSKYANADLFVMLSEFESYCIAAAEALAAKTPCIVANASALREWIDNVNCFGIDYPIVIEQLAGLINEVMGRKIGAAKFCDWEYVVGETLKVYNG